MAEEQAKEQETAKARALAQEQAKEHEQAKARALAEEQAKEQDQAKARALAEEQAKEQDQAKARALAEEQAKEQEKAKARALAEEQARKEEQAKAQVLAEQQATEQEQAKAQALAQQLAALEAEQLAALDEQDRLIEAARQKRNELEEAHMTLLAMEQQVHKQLASADAIMQAQVQPEMPGAAATKLEACTPQTSPRTDTAPCAETPMSERSQDAQNPWVCRKLFPSPGLEPVGKLAPPSETQQTLLQCSQQSTQPAFPKASSPGGPSPPSHPAASPSVPKHPPISSAPKASAKAISPAAVKSPPVKAPAPTKAAITKRILRCLEPNAKGTFKVSKEIRDMYASGGRAKERVYELFAECGNDSVSPALFCVVSRACFEACVVVCCDHYNGSHGRSRS